MGWGAGGGGETRRRDLRAGKRSGGEAGRQPEVGVKLAD